MTAPVEGAAAVIAIDALVTGTAAAAAQLSENTMTLLGAAWTQVSDHRDPDQLALFAARAARVIQGAEATTGRLTEAFLRRVLARMGVAVPRGRLINPPASFRNGTPLEEVVLRPSATVRFQQSEGAPAAAARAAGRARLEAQALTNIALAQRSAARDVVTRLDAVTGYRRIIRPELSESGSCGLCIAAASRIYSKRDLLPLHDKCKCIVMPVTRLNDPGLQLNDEDLRRLYGEAGGTARAKLQRTRYRIEQHGELGPVLVPQGRAFRTAADAGESILGSGARGPRRSDADSYRAQLDTLEASIPNLERRAREGEDVAAALTWQRARLAELRRLVRGRAA